MHLKGEDVIDSSSDEEDAVETVKKAVKTPKGKEDKIQAVKGKGDADSSSEEQEDEDEEEQDYDAKKA